MTKRSLRPVLLLAISIFFAAPALAGTFTVTNLNDSGAGSLRQAITQANSGHGNTVAFGTTGTITLASPLPNINKRMTVDGSTAPGFAGIPLVSVDFNGNAGFMVATGADRSVISGLSLVGSQTAAITLRASSVSVQGNYIGLRTNGTSGENMGDGIRILGTSKENLIGNADPVSSIDYTDAQDAGDFTVQPVSAWQGIRNYAAGASDDFLICGSSNDNGLLYVGPSTGGGASYLVQYPGTTTIATSVYGPDNLTGSTIRLVGSYRKSGSEAYNYGFAWEGTLAQLPSGGVFRTIDYPGASYQFTHSTMGKLAVGNADGPALNGNLPLGAGKAYIYNLSTGKFVTNIRFPNSKSNTAYGIWQNGPDKYTICGGYSPVSTNNLQNPLRPLTQGKAFLVDYDASKPPQSAFSNWTSFEYPNGPAGVKFITHFEGISSKEPGVYTLSADSVQTGSPNTVQGSWVTVRRGADGSFDEGFWVDLNYPGIPGVVTSSNSVYGNTVVGLVIGATPLAYQAQVNTEFQLSNVISRNRGNGINIMGARENVIAMNYIGTDPAGSTATGFGNGANGILVTSRAADNLIGGQSFGDNNPTGSKNPANAVFQRPPQGNLISGNGANGVLINSASTGTVLSGNYIGTDAAGTAALGNARDGVVIDHANSNSLIGCTFYENPFVYYNVIAGNRGHGLRIDSSDSVIVQANFLGMGADNATSVPNGGDGMLVSGTSKGTQVGGVIPLGNVISGNTLNGIELTDKVSGFISFNTFCGIGAFQPFASPNGKHGMLITSTGGSNTIRTCIVSGNLGSGIVLAGNAQGVEITDTSAGTTTGISSAIPNQGHGILIKGRAHDNYIGGFQPSVERAVYSSGNVLYGIAVTEGAHDNRIFAANVGIGAGNSGAIPNQLGGILLDAGTYNTTIGGKKDAFRTTIQSNAGAGLFINASRRNTILNNTITDNQDVGVYAKGACGGTAIRKSTITGNGAGGTDNVDLGASTGVVYVP